MRGASFFSGAGGLDLGLDRAGVEVVLQCEIDPFRRALLARHWPDVPRFTDIREVHESSLRRRLGARSAGGSDNDDVARGERPLDERRRDLAAQSLGGVRGSIDLAFGGFPCQDLSTAGARRGFAGGERSSLFFEFARCADLLLGPGGWLLLENVPGLLSSHGGRDFGVLLATVAELGFHDLAWRVLDSRYFGVPQRRRRVFILARRARGRRAATVLLEPESGGGDFEAGRDPRAGFAGSPTDGARSARTITSRSGGRLDHETEDFIARRSYYVEDGENGTLLGGVEGRVDKKPLVSGRPIVGEVADPITAGRGDGSNPAGRRQEDDWNLVANTLKGHAGAGGSGLGPEHNFTVDGAAADPDRVRAATGLSGRLDRCAFDPKPDGVRYAACGDAVTVPVAEWIGKRLVEHGG